MLSRLFTIAAERSDELELMDDPSVGGAELERTLEEIERMNRAFGGYGPSVGGLAALTPSGTRRVRVLDVGTGSAGTPRRMVDWGRSRGGGLAALTPSGTRRVRVLDVGTGSADTPRRMVDWGRSRGVEVRVTGIDLAETTVAVARRLSRSHPEIEVDRINLFDIPDEEDFDVVHAGLVLHHFQGRQTALALRKMYALARWGVVVNDLHRHPLAWASAKLVTRLMMSSPMVKNDAVLSVLRAFTKADLITLCDEAELPTPEISWRPMFRWRMLIRRT